MEDAYPKQLAEFVQDQWIGIENKTKDEDMLPSLSILEQLLSTTYQASLLHDEGRSVTFRLILCKPDRFTSNEGPPTGLHCLEFTDSRPFTAHELKQLSQAADYYRSLIGIKFGQNGKLRIWGIIHSGPRWLREVAGGRRASVPLPPSLVIKIIGPGSLEVCKGSLLLAKLDQGYLIGKSLDVFNSLWLPAIFAPFREEYLTSHIAMREQTQKPRASLDPDLPRMIGQHMVRRMIAAIRDSNHGGTLILISPERTVELCHTNRYINFKYTFLDGEPRRRWGTLIVKALNTLAEVYGSRGTDITVGWKEYEKSTNGTIVELDEAIFEFSYLIARLAAVDGAVVLTKQFELLGFGTEIKLEQAHIPRVARALDLEGHQEEMESVENVGTRHRSAYRLFKEMPDALAIVISQDKGVHFIKCRNGTVTYWNHGGA